MYTMLLLLRKHTFETNMPIKKRCPPLHYYNVINNESDMIRKPADKAKINYYVSAVKMLKY